MGPLHVLKRMGCRLRLRTLMLLCFCSFIVFTFLLLCNNTLEKARGGGTNVLDYPGELNSEISDRSRSLRDQVVELSRRYVESLAAEQRSQNSDHLYSGKRRGETLYDMKKTLAVLLENMLRRLDRVDAMLIRVQNLLLNQSVPFVGNSLKRRRALSPNNDDSRLSAIELLQGNQEDCSLPPNYKAHFPNCDDKLGWMKTFWRSDPCYARFGVDGSICSMLIYLSEVESHCPLLAFRPKPTLSSANRPAFATPQFSIDKLFALMQDNGLNYEWIKGRLRRMWPKWVRAYQSLELKQNWTLEGRVRKTILLHLGLLTKESGFKFGEKSLKGGPLGELVQWSDLIAVLFVLGHNLVISSEIKTFLAFSKADPALKSSCPVEGTSEHVHLIYTDIVGLRQMKKKMQASLQNYKCRLRVLDSFGTQAEFNYMPYFVKHKTEYGSSKRNVWGGHGLNLQQFYTMYPHSADNTFLGFVVETHSPVNATMPSDGSFSFLTTLVPGVTTDVFSQKWALVYGKEAYMWSRSTEYMKFLKKFVQIHGTVANDEKNAIPSFVHNHGVLSGPQFHRLLGQSHFFIGLGFPYEGPAALEAVANGAIFINPKFVPPKSRLTEKFFADKPTLRALKSQNPYAEDFIGEPYVLTLDISDHDSVRQAIKQALSTKVTPFLPYEFTHEGMLERMNALLEHQDLCSPQSNWPPISALHVLLAQAGVSCQEACSTANLICELSYFPKINNLEIFQRVVKDISHECNSLESQEEVYLPAINMNSRQCIAQDQRMLFSCAAKPPVYVRRICPCRDYIRGQTALCTACL